MKTKTKVKKTKEKTKYYYRVIVEYGGGLDYDYDRKLEATVRRASDAAGTFMATGARDIQWCVPTKARAEAMVTKLRALRGKRKKVSLSRDIDA